MKLEKNNDLNKEKGCMKAKKFYLALLFLCVIFASRNSFASNEEAIFFAFNEYCANKIENFDNIRAVATVLKWKPLNEAQMSSIRPPEGSVEGWAGSRNGTQFLLVLNSAYIQDVQVYVCSIIGYQLDANSLNQYVQKYLHIYKSDIVDEPLHIIYRNVADSSVGTPIQVDVSNSKEPNNSIVKIEAFFQLK